MSETLGTIANLWCYPVKSLRAQSLKRAVIESDGLRGDRRAALFVTAGHARAGNTFRGKEHELLHTLDDPAVAEAAAAARGVDVTLESGERYFDEGAVSVIFDTWMAEAEQLCEMALEPLRFRPNVFVRTAGTGLVPSEAELVGHTLIVGAVQLRVASVINRCVTPTYDLATGVSDPRILREIAQHRANVMGIYCSVAAPGEIALGDSVELRAS